MLTCCAKEKLIIWGKIQYERTVNYNLALDTLVSQFTEHRQIEVKSKFFLIIYFKEIT
jgi:hypothetical protein